MVTAFGSKKNAQEKSASTMLVQKNTLQFTPAVGQHFASILLSIIPTTPVPINRVAK